MMAEQIVSAPRVPEATAPSAGEARVSAEEYMERYAHDHYEWTQGGLIEMAPVSLHHDNLVGYLYILLKTYFSFNPIGTIMQQPFVMRLDAVGAYREPDLQIILKDNPGQLTETAMVGPADICVEIVSPESVERDYGSKFVEYEKGGVREYWLIDPLRRVAHFHRLGEDKVYHPESPDAEGFYQTALLPELKLHVATLWQETLPDVLAIVEAVRQMVGK